jgi:hypothetical protein
LPKVAAVPHSCLQAVTIDFVSDEALLSCLKFLKYSLEIVHFKIAQLDQWLNEIANFIQEGPSSEADTFSADVQIPLIF